MPLVSCSRFLFTVGVGTGAVVAFDVVVVVVVVLPTGRVRNRSDLKNFIFPWMNVSTVQQRVRLGNMVGLTFPRCCVFQ